MDDVERAISSTHRSGLGSPRADVRLRCATGESYMAHSSLLADRSRYFADALGRARPSSMPIDLQLFINRDVLREMLCFIYTGRTLTDFNAEVMSRTTMKTADDDGVDPLVERILTAADAYGLAAWKCRAETALCEEIAVDDVARLLQLAVDAHAPMLGRRCIHIVASREWAALASVDEKRRAGETLLRIAGSKPPPPGSSSSPAAADNKMAVDDDNMAANNNACDSGTSFTFSTPFR